MTIDQFNNQVTYIYVTWFEYIYVGGGLSEWYFADYCKSAGTEKNNHKNHVEKDNDANVDDDFDI